MQHINECWSAFVVDAMKRKVQDLVMKRYTKLVQDGTRTMRLHTIARNVEACLCMMHIIGKSFCNCSGSSSF